ncbi:recombinase [Tetragenococcus halophilus]|uniref:Recombinase n=1 Tax=Tetragenococcus halophilus TaxID=51669 RepID=A0AB35HMI2_TETHA|nr:recombinase [Tetragenococcus halophilus]MCO8297446.1 recombinase [Tetragenococcus halophilus]
MEDYEDHKAEIEKISKHNEQLLAEFQQSLIDKQLSSQTIRKHMFNVDLYINDFLLYSDDELLEAKQGPLDITEFFGYWFIREAPSSSVTQMNESIVSLKKFYTFMYERGDIDKDILVYLKETIKEDKDEWISNMIDYDFPLM